MTTISTRQLVRELHGGEPYDYYPLGEHVVVAPSICGGRPTFKYTRLEVGVVLALIAGGASVEEAAEEYTLSGLTPAAVGEAIRLAGEALAQTAMSLQPTG